MGCGTSSPPAVAAPGATDDIEKKRKRERELTGGTDAITVPSRANSSVAEATISSPDNYNTKTDIMDDFQPSISSRSVMVGNLSILYACKSQRGRDPDHPNKPNQDCFGHHTNSISAFFAVYDGHGPRGEHCSHFVRTTVPVLLKKNLQQRGLNPSSPLSNEDVHASLHDAHVVCNDDLRRSAEIDDSHSGTTSAGVFVHDNKITVANVGDSRIVLGTMATSGAILAVPLSKDHTPHRADEAERCVASGARILSFGQIDPATNDDDIEDPPRVWSRDGNYPGTAFTRSIGDSAAEGLGVYAEPEMVTLPVSASERLLVLASDGVFDVVSNQDVVNLAFVHRNDPVRACDAIIEKSHEEWLLNDDCGEDEANYDDMTCVVVYFDHPEHQNVDSSLPPFQKLESTRPHGKRVRQKTLRNLEAMGE